MNFSSTSLWRWKKRMKSDFCNSFHKQHERLWSFLLSSTTKTFSSRFSHPFNPRFCEKCFQFSFSLCVFVCVSVWMCGNSGNFERIFFSSSPWIQMIRKSVWRQKNFIFKSIWEKFFIIFFLFLCVQMNLGEFYVFAYGLMSADLVFDKFHHFPW